MKEKYSDSVIVTIARDPIDVVDRFCKLYVIHDKRLITDTKSLIEVAKKINPGDVLLYHCEDTNILNLFRPYCNEIFGIAVQNGLEPLELAGASSGEGDNNHKYSQIWLFKRQ